MSYIVSVDMCLLSKDLSEVVEDRKRRERGIHCLMESQGHKKEGGKKKSHFYLNSIMGLLSRAEY